MTIEHHYNQIKKDIDKLLNNMEEKGIEIDEIESAADGLKTEIELAIKINNDKELLNMEIIDPYQERGLNPKDFL